jgi:membrane protein DedA with SNARE-associated domain
MSPADTLIVLGSSPIALAAAIILTSFILEDAATVAAALLAASGAIAPPLAFAAVFAGIFLGDLGLYGLGAAARTQEWARRRIGAARVERGRLWLEGRLAPALIGARFVPGLRLPAYGASGFLGVPFVAFAAITSGASLVWSALAFGLVYAFGAMALDGLGLWKWAAAALLIGAVIFGPAIARRVARPR